METMAIGICAGNLGSGKGKTQQLILKCSELAAIRNVEKCARGLVFSGLPYAHDPLDIIHK